ncbi:MAG: DUF935 domain-containing protein [Ideonella sp.]|nr:DUF935 domain-containing protein [Ideonella sp.]MCC7455979.1 DUF935 domain-containing protein [Nitrospira sp.]
MATILDSDGNPIDRGRLGEPQTAETGWLHREFAAHPARGLTPAQLGAIMQRAEDGDLLDQLDLADDIEERDGHAYAELAKRKGAVSALEWDVHEPEGASVAEKALTEQLREWLRALPDFEDVLHGMMDGVLKGFAAHEMVWQPQGRVLLPTLTFRPQRWFTLDQQRQGLLLRSQSEQQPARGYLPAVMGEALRPYAWLLHVPRSRNGYLARASLVRVLAWPYLFKNYAARDLAEFLEIYGLPLRLGSYPAGASDDEKRSLLRAVTEIGHNAAGVIPQGMKIEFQNAAQGTHVPFSSMLQFMEAVQSKVILGQTLTAGEGQHGTQALGTVHNEVRMDIRAADVRQVEGTLGRQLLQPLAQLNVPGAQGLRLPRFKLDIGEAEDVAAYAEALPKLAGAGMRIPVQWAHEKLRIPMAEAGDDVLEGPPAPVAPGDGGDDGGEPGQPAAGAAARRGGAKPAAGKPGRSGDDKRQGKEALAAEVAADEPGEPHDAIDDLIDDAIGPWRPLLVPLVDPLLQAMQQAVAAGETLEAFAARLPELVERLDGKPLAERLARAAFVARLAGEANLDLNHDEE